jgi:hypothetical protein
MANNVFGGITAYARVGSLNSGVFYVAGHEEILTACTGVVKFAVLCAAAVFK